VIFDGCMGKSLISNVLKTLMFKKNVNTSQLARELDLPQQTLQRIVSGASPNPHGKTLKPIADFFDISLDQLKGETPLPDSVVDLGLPTITKIKAKEIPVVNWKDIETYLDNPETYTTDEHVFADPTLSHDTFAITLSDSSMEPYFPKGSLLILDPTKPTKDRCFVLVKITESNTLVFRQLLIDGEHQYLKPLNPDLNTFPMRLLNDNDKTLGVMAEFRYKYDDV